MCSCAAAHWCEPGEKATRMKLLHGLPAAKREVLRDCAWEKFFYACRSDLFCKPAWRFCGFFPRSFPCVAAATSPRLGALSIIQWQSPAWWSARRACLRGCDASPRARILRLRCGRLAFAAVLFGSFQSLLFWHALFSPFAKSVLLPWRGSPGRV
jgi:hypothetical protein